MPTFNQLYKLTRACWQLLRRAGGDPRAVIASAAAARSAKMASAMRLFISRAAAWFKSFAPPFCHPPLPWWLPADDDVMCRTRHAPSLACRRCADRRVGVNPGTLLLWNGWADFQSEKRTAQRKVRCVRWARPFASAALPAGGVASPSKVHPKVRTLYRLDGLY